MIIKVDNKVINCLFENVYQDHWLDSKMSFFYRSKLLYNYIYQYAM